MIRKYESNENNSDENTFNKRRKVNELNKPNNKLTINLLDTYNNIYNKNKMLNKDGFYKITPNEILKNKYIVTGILGKGSFGEVISVKEINTNNKNFAIKIIRNKLINNVNQFKKNSEKEIKILYEINKVNIKDKYPIIKFFDNFTWNDHLCLIFEKMYINLYQMTKMVNNEIFTLTKIKSIGYQINKGLEFLSSLSIIHCDLKPENISLKDKDYDNIQLKIIDFGSSCKVGKTTYDYIQTRWYRSPEILLGIKYNCAIDIWSLGCILMELFIGDVFISGKNYIHQMYKIVKIIGYPTNDMIDKGKNFYTFFKNKNFEIAYPKFFPTDIDNFDTIFNEQLNRKKYLNESDDNLNIFKDLLKKIFDIDPKTRITSKDISKHIFFK